MQMKFELPELDRKATQKAVEEILEKYRIFKTIHFEEREATITASYVPREGDGRTNVTTDQTADIAIHNVDVPAARRQFCERIDRAVARLHPKEYLLLTERYMKEDYVYDFVVYQLKFNPPISQKTYDKIRWKSFYKLALILDIAVEKQ